MEKLLVLFLAIGIVLSGFMVYHCSKKAVKRVQIKQSKQLSQIDTWRR